MWDAMGRRIRNFCLGWWRLDLSGSQCFQVWKPLRWQNYHTAVFVLSYIYSTINAWEGHKNSKHFCKKSEICPKSTTPGMNHYFKIEIGLSNFWKARRADSYKNLLIQLKTTRHLISLSLRTFVYMLMRPWLYSFPFLKGKVSKNGLE